MKYIYLIIMALAISCGSGGGGGDNNSSEPAKSKCGIESALIGTWDDTSKNNQLTIDNNCMYQSTFCNGSGVILPVDSVYGIDRFLIRISKTDTIQGCLAEGDYICAYDLTGNGPNTLRITCDNKTYISYIRN